MIGIDAYEHVSRLAGCVNDARLMERALVDTFGFPAENVRVLTDAAASRDGILRALAQLVADTRRDDVVVLYYAGHGSRMTDREGDEPSGMDSTLVPVDSGRDRRVQGGGSWPNRDITDDEIAVQLAALAARTPYVTLIVDACHSGTITRDGVGPTFGVRSRGVEPDTRPAAELPPSPFGAEQLPDLMRAAGTRSVGGGPRDVGGESGGGLAPVDGRYVLIAGCRDEERSYEYRAPAGQGGATVTHGALTYFLVQALGALTRGTTYRDVFEQVAARVTATYREQHPQMEGRVDREFLGVRDVVPMRHVRILAVEGAGGPGDGVTLGTGAALGAAAGARYAVYPPGTKTTAGVSPTGELELLSVGAATSGARVLSGVVVADARAIPTAPPADAPRLAVQLIDLVSPDARDAALRELRDRLAASPLLTLVDEGRPADVRVYRLPSRRDASPEDHVPQLGPLAGRTWAVIGGDGQLVAPPLPEADGASMAANIDALAHYRRALFLTNPDTASALKGQFTLELLRLEADGTPVVASPDATGRVVYEEGDRFGFRVTSRHDRAAFVSLVDFGLTGRVGVVYPPPGTQGNLLAPGVTLDVLGYRAMHRAFDGWKIEVPSGFPFAATPGSAQAVEGTETVKLLVTTEPADFAFLAQPAFRGRAPTRSGGHLSTPERSLRDIAPAEDETGSTAGDDWATVERTFVVRRRRRATLADGTTTAVGTATVLPTGLTGQVDAVAGSSFGTDARPATGERSGSDRPRPRSVPTATATDPLAQALGTGGGVVRQTLTVEAAMTPRACSRSAGLGAPEARAIDVRLPDPGPDFGQLLLGTDALGRVSFHFETDAAPPGIRDAPGGVLPGGRTFRVPVRAPVSEDATAEHRRGATRELPVRAATQLVLKHVTFPLFDPVVGAVGEHYAGRWEARYRPYRVRRFGPDDYTADTTGSLDADGWRRLGGGQALLFVHGPFARAHAAFGGLPRELMAALHAQYGGRVFAFDHFTLSEDPADNLRRFAEQMPGDATLDLDIVCHSRGGLVSRLLAERQSELSLGARHVRVRRVVFVGTPNAGTPLADTKRICTLIDTYATLLNLIPEPTAKEALEGVITVAKQLAVGVARGLAGLHAMCPGGPFATRLNSGTRDGTARYHALASDYEPRQAGLRALLADRLIDGVFDGAGNDLVVAAAGVWGANGSGYFPIGRRRVLEGAESVAHTRFFASPVAQRQLLAWLQAD